MILNALMAPAGGKARPVCSPGVVVDRLAPTRDPARILAVTNLRPPVVRLHALLTQ